VLHHYRDSQMTETDLRSHPHRRSDKEFRSLNLKMSFPRKRESRVTAPSLALDPRFRAWGCTYLRTARSIPPPLVGGGQGAGFARGSAPKSRSSEDTSLFPATLMALANAGQESCAPTGARPRPPKPPPTRGGGMERPLSKCVHPQARKRGSRATNCALALDSRFRAGLSGENHESFQVPVDDFDPFCPRTVRTRSTRSKVSERKSESNESLGSQHFPRTAVRFRGNDNV
jgi:hypothetical protein